MSLELKNVNNSGYTELRNLYNSGYFSLAFSGSEVPTTTTTTSTTSTTTTAPTTTTTTTTTTSTTTSTTTVAPTTTTSTTTSTTTATPTTTSTTTTTTTAAGGIVTDNLFMKLDASNYTSGLWSDETGNGNNASVSGATWLSDNGGIFDFDGINDTISIPHTASLSLSTTSQRTIQVWVKFDTFPTSTDRAIVFSKLSGAYTFDGYFGGPNLNGEIVVATNGNVAKTSVSALTISLNTWYLFTFISQITSTANTTKAYINETEYITDANGGNTYSESNPLTLGYMPAPLTGLGAIAYLNGKIGACYFYTKGLSAAEVSTNYNATKARYETTTTTTSTTTTTTTEAPTTTTTTTSTTTTTTTEAPTTTTTTSTTTTTTTAAPTTTTTTTTSTTTTTTTIPTTTTTSTTTTTTTSAGSFDYTPGTFFDVFTQQSGITSSISFNSNNGCWQLFYANQPVTMSVGSGNIGLVPHTNGSNSWTWYVATGSVNDSTGSWSSVFTVSTLRSGAYVGGQLTTSSLNTTIRIPANRYFLIANSGGPFYRTIRPLANDRVGNVSGSAFVTAVNRVALGNWPSGGTTTIPTQFGGAGSGYTLYTGSVHVMSVKFTQ